MDFQENGRGLMVPEHKIIMGGRFHIEHRRPMIEPHLGFQVWETLDEFDVENLVVNQGLNHILNVEFDGATQITQWYLGLFQGNYTPVATDTAATIAANSTEASGYTAGVRQPWVQAGASAQSITNSASRASFTFNYVSATSIYGAFLASTATISGTSGTLFSAARFSTAKSVINLDQLLLTYTFTASSV